MTTEELYSPIEAESANTNSLRNQLLQSLKTSEEYRYAFVEERIQSGLAAQIHTIREQREMDPKQFAERLGKKVSWVYRLEDPNLPPPTIPSLLEVARTFGVDLEVRFRPFSELLKEMNRLSPDSLRVASFSEELPGLERTASSEGLRSWIQNSDYAAIRRYSENTKRMAEQAGIDWKKVRTAARPFSNAFVWGKMPLFNDFQVSTPSFHAGSWAFSQDIRHSHTLDVDINWKQGQEIFGTVLSQPITAACEPSGGFTVIKGGKTSKRRRTMDRRAA